jgi:DNA polymerase
MAGGQMNNQILAHIDCETYSTADLSRVGAHQYARDPSTRLLLVAWQYDHPVLGPWPVQLWDAVASPEMPEALRNLLDDLTVTRVAFNAAFEMAIFEHCPLVEFDPGRWLCTQALALSYGLPASLAGVGDALGLQGADAKMADGKKLMRIFSLPNKSGARVMPDQAVADWTAFGTYCRRDVVAERAIYRRLTV